MPPRPLGLIVHRVWEEQRELSLEGTARVAQWPRERQCQSKEREQWAKRLRMQEILMIPRLGVLVIWWKG